LQPPPPPLTRRNILGPVAFFLTTTMNPISSSAKDGASVDSAFKAQAEETNARLTASGFKLDSAEQENKKLTEGLASFSYDDFQGGGAKQKSTKEKRYRKR